MPTFNRQRTPVAIITQEMIDDKTLDAKDIMIYAVIMIKDEKEGWVDTEKIIPELTKRWNCSSKKAEKAIQKLTEKGFLIEREEN